MASIGDMKLTAWHDQLIAHAGEGIEMAFSIAANTGLDLLAAPDHLRTTISDDYNISEMTPLQRRMVILAASIGFDFILATWAMKSIQHEAKGGA